MASFAEGKIQAYVGPPELGAADDLEQVIVEFIAGAKTRLDIAVQEIDSRAIAQAILDARWRGVKVTIFLKFGAGLSTKRPDRQSPQAPDA
jgi:phosphatidylserine/phosphatidylglycerophosphate/cardiolipin synthase-like enzyme